MNFLVRRSVSRLVQELFECDRRKNTGEFIELIGRKHFCVLIGCA